MKEAPDPGPTASGPLRAATHRGNRFGGATQPSPPGGGGYSLCATVATCKGSAPREHTYCVRCSNAADVHV